MKHLKTAVAVCGVAPPSALRTGVFPRRFGFAICAAMALCVVPLNMQAQSVRAPVNLGTAGNYVVLSETGITDVPPSAIVGNIGASPITGAAVHLSCAEVTGTISVVDAAGPAPCSPIVPAVLGQAILDMGTAYAAAAGLVTPPPDAVNLGAGNISGLNIVPGLYKWSTGVTVNTNVTLTGGPNAVWIFQISGDLLLANGAQIVLAGGAQANNVFWQVAGPTSVTLGTGAVFNGTILSAKQVIINTGSTLNGRALAQTQVTLESTGITTPGPLVGGIPILVGPSVTSTSPANLSANVPINSAVSAAFSEPMNPATITAATFTLKNGAIAVPGTVSYVGVTATFSPSASLPSNTTLTATVTTGAQDLTGNALAANYVWTFATGASANLTPPTVSSTVPANGATNVPTGSALAATFSEAMNPATINAATFTLKQGNTTVPGTVNYSGVTATFTPAGPLAASVTFTAAISTGAQDLAGNSLAANYIWTFTTGAGPSLTPPTVSSTVPMSGATNVPAGNALSATFSEAMNPLTITTLTFNLHQGNTAITGTVSYAGVTATFTPASALTANLLYTATITTGVQDLSGNALAANYVWSFTSAAGTSTQHPAVSFTNPLNQATNVPVGNAVAAYFTEAMNPLSITTSTFILQQYGSIVPGAVTYAGVTATFTPLSNLAPNTVYFATVTSRVSDLAGNTLLSNYVWSFTTGVTPNTTPPTVISTVPATGAAGVPIGNALAATFSEALNPLTITTATFTLKQGAAAIPGAVNYSGVTATFTPLSKLAANTLFTATITTGVQDLSGNALAANYVWTFTTGAAPGLTPPAVISTAPASGASAVTITTNIVANFSEAINPLTINTLTFVLQQGTTQIPGAVTYAGTSATFRPLSMLAPNTVYSAMITTGVADLSGNFLPANYLWSFTTGTSSGQTPVCLANFAILSGGGVFGSGSSIVTGDIGVAAGSSVNGFPPATLNGTIHTGDQAAAQGIASLTAAYADAVSRSVGDVSVSGDFGGQMFTAGLYSATGALTISSGNLTLDAKGNPNAVFIFQTASTFTTGAGIQIVLANGAQAFNVFVQAGTSATLGSNSVFNGSILANQSITMGTGSVVNGRLEAVNGPVTLQSSSVTSPLPIIAPGGILNAADDAPTVAPGSIATVFGNNLSSSLTSASGYPLPTTLGGSSYTIGAQAAPLYMTSCSQVNLQIPWESAGLTQPPVTATTGDLTSTSQPLNLVPFAPGIFALNMVGSAQGAVQIAPTGQLAGVAGTGSSPVARGAYVAIFCTGLGAVSNQPATGAAAPSIPLSYTLALPVVTIGGAPAQVTFSGLAPGFAGLYQVNAVVPAGAPSGGSISLFLSIGGVTSNTVTIAVQ